MGLPYYLKVGRASDLPNFKERIIYRALEIMPGFLIWSTLIGMVLASWLKPVWAAVFIIAFCVFWLVRVAHFSFHLVFAYRKMKKNLRTDWLKALQNLPNWEKIYHLVILPVYKENYEILKGTFDALAESRYPKEKMLVVLALEERGPDSTREAALKIEKEYADKFFKFLLTFHPKNIPGEIPAKGSNINWAGRRAKQELIDPLKIPYENAIVSCFDIDTQVFPDYFSRLAFSYLTCPNPCRCSFQPVPLYLNNLWEAPFFSRVVSSCNVFWQMMQQERPEKIVTYSSHSMSFKALAEIDFWQANVVSDDAGIFWKAFLFYGGNYKIIPLHYPLSMDSCAAGTFWQTAVNQYKQQRRWAFGSEGIPYLLFGFLKNKNISLGKKFSYSLLTVEGFWAWGTNAFLILFLGWLPLILGGEHFKNSVLAYNLPQITRNLMNLAFLGLIVCIIISALLLTPRPKWCSRWKRASMIFQWVFFPIAFILFGAVPAIDAQTRLMLGKYVKFWATKKSRLFLGLEKRATI